MPVATVTTEAQRFPLKSLPANPNLEGAAGEEGFIVARPLPYGLVLERRDKGTEMGMELEVNRGNRRNKRSIRQDEPETQKIELKTLSGWMANHDFAYCIVDHNLTDKNGQLLDFTNPLAVRNLDPKVGIEIDRILTELNEPEEEEDDEAFTQSPSLSSQEEKVHLSEAPTLKDS
jgi:hypothetical protein